MERDRPPLPSMDLVVESINGNYRASSALFEQLPHTKRQFSLHWSHIITECAALHTESALCSIVDIANITKSNSDHARRLLAIARANFQADNRAAFVAKQLLLQAKAMTSRIGHAQHTAKLALQSAEAAFRQARIDAVVAKVLVKTRLHDARRAHHAYVEASRAAAHAQEAKHMLQMATYLK